MEREEAFQKLRSLIGEDLRPLADRFQITVWKGDKVNKGWAGHTMERYLGLPINSSQSPNFGSWELKVVPLKRNRHGLLQVKETMAITMIDAYNVERTPFEQSHMFAKLRKAIVCARIFESEMEEHSKLHRVAVFDLNDPELLNQVRADYDLVRDAIKTKGFGSLTGKMGVLVQPRTKGAGHGSTSRAFYARPKFVAKILGL
jgi:DNA mismatch repair protein MutH